MRRRKLGEVHVDVPARFADDFEIADHRILNQLAAQELVFTD